MGTMITNLMVSGECKGLSLTNVIRGALRYQIRSFFEHRSKGGGGHFHVQKFWSKFCMILKTFWQHKIDIEMSQIGGKMSKF